MTTAGQPTFETEFRDRLKKIENDARDAGMNLTGICKELGISRATPDRWKRNTPTTIKIMADMEALISKKKASDAAAAQ